LLQGLFWVGTRDCRPTRASRSADNANLIFCHLGDGMGILGTFGRMERGKEETSDARRTRFSELLAVSKRSLRVSVIRCKRQKN
jgi:hypothetical protein